MDEKTDGKLSDAFAAIFAPVNGVGSGNENAGGSKQNASGSTIRGAVDPASATRPKRAGPGRPAKPRDDADDADGGQSAGSKRTKAQAEELALASLRDVLFALHLALAGNLKSPEFMLTADEAEKLATATQNVLRHYKVAGTSQKTKDWLCLLMVAYGVYGPRFAALSARKQAEKPKPAPAAAPRADAGPSVYPFPTGA